MKYNITNRQHLILFQRIYNFIEDELDLDVLSFEEGGVGGYEGIFTLVDSDWNDILVIYMPHFWDEDNPSGLAMVEKSPALRVDRDFETRLNDLFGNLWHEPIKKFIKDNFNIEIKTIKED